ncbi:hypothetical protein Baya_3401 [Bagarius yarrelli]|uniref:Uncharacterized protein n=1 Tax=Bagarius yarrelli TaxID=175774 RepID=A0A556TP51_BAGYA|nr:hypothetical protein Baya_3401 [Bagarius yarrelli]
MAKLIALLPLLPQNNYEYDIIPSNMLMDLAWNMRYDLYYPAAFAPGTVTLLARTEGQLAIIDLEIGPDPTEAGKIIC